MPNSNSIRIVHSGPENLKKSRQKSHENDEIKWIEMIIFMFKQVQ